MEPIVTDLANANPGVLAGWHDLVSRARAAVADSATTDSPTGSNHPNGAPCDCGLSRCKYDHVSIQGVAESATPIPREVYDEEEHLRVYDEEGHDS